MRSLVCKIVRRKSEAGPVSKANHVGKAQRGIAKKFRALDLVKQIRMPPKAEPVLAGGDGRSIQMGCQYLSFQRKRTIFHDAAVGTVEADRKSASRGFCESRENVLQSIVRIATVSMAGNREKRRAKI